MNQINEIQINEDKKKEDKSRIDTTNSAKIEDLSENQNAEQIHRSKIAEIKNRIMEFANEIEDSYHNIYNDEDDPFFKVILSIYRFYNREIDILTILNVIHENAGNIKNALRQLKPNLEPITSHDFKFQNIHAPSEEIEKYFQYT